MHLTTQQADEQGKLINRVRARARRRGLALHWWGDGSPCGWEPRLAPDAVYALFPLGVKVNALTTPVRSDTVAELGAWLAGVRA